MRQKVISITVYKVTFSAFDGTIRVSLCMYFTDATLEMKMNKIGLMLILLTISPLLFVSNTHSASILYLYHLGGKSTTSLHQAISKLLLKNGHQITAVSPIPLSENLANYTDLGVHDDLIKFSDEFSLEDGYKGTFANRKLVYEIQNENCKNIYRNVKLAKAVKNLKVDLVLLEIDGAECFLPFAAQFNVPIIGVTTSYFAFPDLDGVMGNPINPSSVPIPFSELSPQMNFFQRLQNTKDYVLHLLISWYYINEADSIVGEHLESPPIRELYDRIAVVFCNNHFSFLSKPTAPSTVDIAGIHIGNPSPLPKEIQTFIDSSPKGVIYLSLGSAAKFSGLPKHMHDSFTNVMEKLPYRVIWRHDKPEMVSNTSKNILVQKWLPQKDILAHPKVILFITHSGIFSTFEAIYFAVPMLTFPILYDQFTNAVLIKSLGAALPLELHNLNEQSLMSGINEVVQNNKYRENVKKLSNIFKDRPLNPQDTLVYWVNYVLRHKGASNLKPAGAKLPFYQHLLLDVILFLTVVIISTGYIVYSTLKTTTSLLKRLLRNKSTIRKPKTS
ncbi:UDP-glucosyltransferase 2-like [Planococcus citri]|uniref:UDP-glucosyltransferase 2-like n=1 Tax=Planococcus citri TaxID=170843 RepID=UPI0031F771EB